MRITKKEQARRTRVANCAFGIHEAMHTAHVLVESFAAHVAEHPAVAERPEILALADHAISAMCEVYQALGRLPEWNEDGGK